MIVAGLVLFGVEVVLTGLDGQPKVFDPTGRRATVVLFLSTVCPVAADYQPRIAELWREFGRRRDVDFVVVYPNKTESRDDIRRHAGDVRLPFPVYRDDNNALADRIGARVTPTAAVCDRTGATRYLGAIDDAVNPARVKRRYLRDAIRATLSGRQLAVAVTEPYG